MVPARRSGWLAAEMPQTITASGLPVGERVATYTGWQACATTTIAASDIADGRHRPDHAEQVLGLDVAVDYRHAYFPDRLARVAEDGVDLSFDNVGGRQLTLALSVLPAALRQRCPARVDQ